MKIWIWDFTDTQTIQEICLSFSLEFNILSRSLLGGGEEKKMFYKPIVVTERDPVPFVHSKSAIS